MHEHVNNAVREYLREKDAISQTPTPQDVILKIQKDVLESLHAAGQQGSTQQHLDTCLSQLGVEATNMNYAILLELLIKGSLEFRNNLTAANAVAIALDLVAETKRELIEMDAELIKILTDSPDRNEIFRRIENLLKEPEDPCTLTTPPPQSTSDS